MNTISPISNLPDTILLKIFENNTKPIPDSYKRVIRPLRLVRLASHVCQRWRRLLLATSWIWGRVVDFSIVGVRFRIKRKKWMEEVVKRAGSAPLWIYGVITKTPVPATGYKGQKLFDAQLFFVQLLESSQERVEKLAVVSWDKEISERIQRWFISPAPNLRVFDVHFPELREPLRFLDSLQPNSLHSPVLFADDAPALEVLHSRHVVYKLDAPWLSNIRKLDLSRTRFTAEDVMTVLKNTLRLNILDLSTTMDIDKNASQQLLGPQIKIPNLSVINIQSTLLFIGVFLNIIKPGKLSELEIEFIVLSARPNDQDLTTFKNGLFHYTSNFLTTATSTTIRFEFAAHEIRLSDITPLSRTNLGHINFDVRIARQEKGMIGISDAVRSAFLDALTLPHTAEPNSISPFHSVKELQLVLKAVNPTLFPKLHALFSTFPQVQVIEVKEEYTHRLWEIACLEDSQPVVLFPNLHTIRLAFTFEVRPNSNDPRRRLDDLARFLRKRRELGFPVARLDMSWYTSAYPAAFTAFEGIEELELVWDS